MKTASVTVDVVDTSSSSSPNSASPPPREQEELEEPPDVQAASSAYLFHVHEEVRAKQRAAEAVSEDGGSNEVEAPSVLDSEEGSPSVWT